MNWKLIGLWVVLADFAALPAYAVWQYGYVRALRAAFANAATTLAFADLVIALSLIMIWMIGDARQRAHGVLPYLVDHAASRQHRAAALSDPPGAQRRRADRRRAGRRTSRPRLTRRGACGRIVGWRTTCPITRAATARCWDRWAADYVEPGRAAWARPEPAWGIWGVPESDARRAAPTSPGGTPSSWAAAPATCRRGSRGAARGPSGSNSRRPSSPPRARSSASSGSSSRSCRRAPRTFRSPSDASISPSRSTAPACGPIRTAGCPRRRACCGPGGRLIFLTNAFLLTLCLPDGEDGVAGGPPAARRLRHAPADLVRAARRSSSTCRTATGSACCARTASRWRS